MRSFGAAALTDLVRALSTPRRAVVPDAGASPAATDGAGGAALETFDIADRDFNGAPDDIDHLEHGTIFGVVRPLAPPTGLRRGSA